MIGARLMNGKLRSDGLILESLTELTSAAPLVQSGAVDFFGHAVLLGLSITVTNLWTVSF